MTVNRKDFLKKVCFSGACLCGFGSIAFSKEVDDSNEDKMQTQKLSLLQDWIASILLNVNDELDKGSARKLIKKTAGVHFENLKMDTLLAEYKGDLDKFTVFLREKWGWKVDYDKEKRILIADENKNYCVCPIAVHKKDKDSSAICYCSEGFAEKMFSLVSGKQAQAEVIASIRKGDTSCKYKIVLP
ncbi:MAG TPA: hypothetical protein PLQ09_06235 [Prolixibacteraceae bacterium]|jgi:hypothetical protein|nr:hypothetical protein [Prolixibacteraceae bacterium]